MALKPNVRKTPIYPDGTYLCRVAKPEAKERDDFNNRSVKVPGIQWIYNGVKKDKNGIPSELIVNDVTGTPVPVKFAMLTGIDFGPKRAALTKLLPAIVGNAVTKDEAADMDLEALEGIFVNVTVIVENDDEGNPRNKIVKVANAGNGYESETLFTSQTPDPVSDPMAG